MTLRVTINKITTLSLSADMLNAFLLDVVAPITQANLL